MNLKSTNNDQYLWYNQFVVAGFEIHVQEPLFQIKVAALRS